MAGLEEIDEEMTGLDLRQSAAAIPKPAGGTIEEIRDPYVVDQQDLEIIAGLKNALKGLLSAKKQMSENVHQQKANQPFSSPKGKDLAYGIITSMIQLEIDITRLCLETSGGMRKALKAGEKFTDVEFKDMAGMQNFMKFMRTETNKHQDQVLTLTGNISYASQERSDIATKILKESLRCKKHPLDQAQGRSVKSGDLLCKGCLLQELSESDDVAAAADIKKTD